MLASSQKPPLEPVESYIQTYQSSQPQPRTSPGSINYSPTPATQRQFQRLPGPVCIPQDYPGPHEPYSRGWAPVLASHDVNVMEWMAFVDHLNICKAKSAPIHVVNVAGKIAGIATGGATHLIGKAAHHAGQFGGNAMSNSRVKSFIDSSNRDFFHPRGLKVLVADQDFICAVTKQPPKRSVLAPIPKGLSVQQYPTLRQRRMATMHGWCAPVVYNGLPPLAAEAGGIDRWTSRNAIEERQKHEEDRAKDLAEGKTEKLRKDEYDGRQLLWIVVQNIDDPE